jgi:RNA polymerase sigma-B factor
MPIRFVAQMSTCLIPRLAPDEQLFTLWRERRDFPAREQLISRYLPLARRLARRYAGRRESAEDLFQVASLGLLKAVDRFDVRRGAGFTSFAVPTILGELKRHFRDLGWSVHVSRALQERVLKVQSAERTLAARSGRMPSLPDIALYLELSVEEVLDALECAAAHDAVSLDLPLPGEEDSTDTLADQLGTEDERYQRIETKLSIEAATAQLRPRERRILELRFVDELSQAQIAEAVGISQMHVSRILRRTLAQLQGLT